jgi:hypothetical protein
MKQVQTKNPEIQTKKEVKFLFGFPVFLRLSVDKSKQKKIFVWISGIFVWISNLPLKCYVQ